MRKTAQSPQVFVLFATLFCSATIGCGGSGGYDSPQVAFEAMKAAGEKEDWKGFCQCMAPDTLDLMVGTMFTRRRQATLRAALEVTDAFRELAPHDPVRYDFALTRPGIRGDGDLRISSRLRR